MDSMILDSIYAIVGVSFLISWIVLIVQVFKIKTKLYEKSTHANMLYEAQIAEMAGDKLEALKLYYKLLYYEWDNNAERKVYKSKEDEVKLKLEKKYSVKIKNNGGIWPAQFTVKTVSKTEELNTLKAMFENGAYTEEEHIEESAKILSRK